MRTSRAGRRVRQHGFSYLVVLATAVIMAVAAGVAAESHSRVAQLEREAELLFRGQAYRNAIRSYYEAEEPRRYPPGLQDLLQDPRSPHRRHLRALYPDPFGEGSVADWRLLRADDGGISGVASQSRQAPLKKARFPLSLQHFEGAQEYRDWVFEYRPERTIPAVQGK